MKEYIEREALIEALKRECPNLYYASEHELIRTFPSADVAPVVHGEWEWREFYGEHGLMLCCSNCRETEGANMRFEYCPHCGARMDGGNR